MAFDPDPAAWGLPPVAGNPTVIVRLRRPHPAARYPDVAFVPSIVTRLPDISGTRPDDDYLFTRRRRTNANDGLRIRKIKSERQAE